MKILAKALCDHLYHQEKTSLMGVFQHIFLPKTDKSAHLRGNLFISCTFDKKDVVKKQINVRVFVTNKKGKEVREVFAKNLDEQTAERGVNMLIDLDEQEKGKRKLAWGVYDFWISMNGGAPEWITQCTIAHEKK